MTFRLVYVSQLVQVRAPGTVIGESRERNLVLSTHCCGLSPGNKAWHRAVRCSMNKRSQSPSAGLHCLRYVTLINNNVLNIFVAPRLLTTPLFLFFLRINFRENKIDESMHRYILRLLLYIGNLPPSQKSSFCLCVVINLHSQSRKHQRSQFLNFINLIDERSYLLDVILHFLDYKEM